jgi:transposase
MSNTRGCKPYPSDVSDKEWSLVIGYLTLMKEDAPQRKYPLRELFNALRYVVRYGLAWRAMPNDFPPWHAVHKHFAHRVLSILGEIGRHSTLRTELRDHLKWSRSLWDASFSLVSSFTIKEGA